jgi:thioredoxin-like negative regulator of GroEL
VYVVLFVVLAVGSFTQKSATWDEPIHLTAGYLAAANGDYRVDPSHPPLLRMWAALPLLAMDLAAVDTSIIDRTADAAWLQDAYRFSSDFLYRAKDADRLLYAARFMVVLWGAALGVLVFFWAREWLGFAPAVVALVLYAIEPGIAAHAQLVTTDLGGACFMCGAVYWLWRTSRRPGVWSVAALTACVALAFVTKFSAVLLIPILLPLAVVSMRQMNLGFRTAAGIAVLLTASTFAVIWAVYGFRYRPSESTEWMLRLQDAAIAREGAPALASIVAAVDALAVLPNAYTQGLLMSQASAGQTSYLAGEYSEDGWWYYFPVAFLVKTPSVLILLVLGGIVLLVIRHRRLNTADTLFVVLPPAVYLGFAMASGINIGIRHILPIYPFVVLIAAFAARELWSWRAPIGQLVLAGLLVYSSVRFIGVYPHLLAYFNEFAGGPDEGLAYLSDSNLDWGQDLKPLKAWMDDKQVQHVNLAYFGTADPRYYGIERTALPGTPFVRSEKPRLPGYVAISTTILSGVYLEPHWRMFYRGFSTLTPVDVIGHTIRVYWVVRWPDAPPDDAIQAEVADKTDERLGDELFFEMNWPRQAAVHYRTALARDRDNPRLTAKLGVALLEAAELRDAVDMLRRSAALEPDSGEARFRLATALLQNGQHQEAVVQAEAAVRLKPWDPAAHDTLGIALAKVGRLEEAEAALERSLQFAPDHVRAREHLRLLRESR